MNSKEIPSEKKASFQGLVQIFTGEGKGKTSAALGTVVRALGRGFRVCIVVFMKGNYPYSEWKFLSDIPGVTIARYGFNSFTNPAEVKPEEKRQAEEALAFAREAMLSRKYDLIVLDEINVASGWGLIDVEAVVKLIHDRPPDVELVMTGRDAHPRLLELADMVSEIHKIKHPYDKGILARKGLDY